MSNNFNLLDILGWTDQKPCVTPVISVHESPVTPADVVTAAFIAHTINTGGSVCLVGVRYPFTHYNYICKKMVRVCLAGGCSLVCRYHVH